MSPGAQRAVQVECHEGAGAIAQLRPLWQALVAADDEAGLFQSPALCAAWQAGAADAGQRLWLLVARRDGQPVGLWPLCWQPGQRWQPRTLASASPRAGVLATGDRAAVLAGFAAWLRAHSGRWDLLVLDELRTAPAHRLIAALGAARGLELEGLQPASGEACILTAGGWSAYLERRGPHFRHRLRPQTRKIERLGPVTLRRHLGAGAAAAYEDFLALEPRSWKSRQDDTRLPERERAAFRHLLAENGPVQPDLLFLDVAGKPAAAMLSLVHGGVYHLFVTYFDDGLRAWYPGRRLFLEAIQQAYAWPGITEISFIGAYPFARAWCDEVRDHWQLRAWSGSWRARCCRWLGARSGVPAAPAAIEPAAETAHV